MLAFGSPLGLDHSVSLGVVSATARQLEPESPMIYVQTDAAINPGSSGGPLVDLRGRIVGINTLILSQTGGSEGLGFSAPSNIVRTVYEQIRQFGRVRRGDIGVRAQTVTPMLARGLALPRERGVVLADVIPGSPADRAGLRAGDMVLLLDGKPMDNGRQLQVNLYRHVVGDVVALEILRDGRAARFPVAVTERRDLSFLSDAVDARQHMVARLGILGLDLTDQIRQMLPAHAGRHRRGRRVDGCRRHGFARRRVCSGRRDLCRQPRAGERARRSARAPREAADRRSRRGATAAARRADVSRVHPRVSPDDRRLV